MKALPSHFPPSDFFCARPQVECVSVWVWSDEGFLFPPRSVLRLAFHFLCGSPFPILCMCMSSPCAHRAGLRYKINHSRWLLWNLITLIICTSLPHSSLVSPGKPVLFMAQPLCFLLICIWLVRPHIFKCTWWCVLLERRTWRLEGSHVAVY